MNASDMPDDPASVRGGPSWRWRDCWIGALVFGLLGPLFGGAPLIVLFALGMGLESAITKGALAALSTFGAVFAMGWVAALGLGGAPGALTGALSSAYRRRLTGRRRVLTTLAIGMVMVVAWPLVLDAFDHWHPSVAGKAPIDHPWSIPVGGYLFFFWLPALWATPACEAVMGSRWISRLRLA